MRLGDLVKQALLGGRGDAMGGARFEFLPERPRGRQAARRAGLHELIDFSDNIGSNGAIWLPARWRVDNDRPLYMLSPPSPPSCIGSVSGT